MTIYLIVEVESPVEPGESLASKWVSTFGFFSPRVSRNYDEHQSIMSIIPRIYSGNRPGHGITVERIPPFLEGDILHHYKVTGNFGASCETEAKYVAAYALDDLAEPMTEREDDGTE